MPDNQTQAETPQRAGKEVLSRICENSRKGKYHIMETEKQASEAEPSKTVNEAMISAESQNRSTTEGIHRFP